MRALSSTRRQLLLSKGTGSAAQHRTGKHMIPCVFGAKKIVAVKLFVKASQQKLEFASPFWVT